MFQCLLIANRGEIACRVIHTARRLGIQTVAVYSEADRGALHTQLADQAYYIGESPATASYLNVSRIIAAARDTGADAVHPGYGFLSENADFARQCEDTGIVFVGPPASAIEAMGSKARAKAIMEKAGVPLIPGYHGDDQSDAVLRRHADAMGYPVLLKATAGGGGKGMRAVENGDDFDEALAAARRESKASFGDDRMLVEKLLLDPRHVEVQVFCDGHGNAVYLSDRDCSIQRRHQKVIEEAPAPGLSDAVRGAMGQAAVEAAKAIDYRGAGTVEFLLHGSDSFYFMEMNTRLQVEHPVTEMVTGLDLVEWQLRVASGEQLPLTQAEIETHGHSMEARIYAEDPANGFVPSTGTINYLRTPESDSATRIDKGIVEGSEVSPYYDPMLAKLIVHGADRETARRRLAATLGDFRVAGVVTNTSYLKRIVELPAFAEPLLSTRFLELQESALNTAQPSSLQRDLAAAAIVLASQRGQQYMAQTARGHDAYSPWNNASGWRVNQAARQQFEIVTDTEELEINLVHKSTGLELSHGDMCFALQGEILGEDLWLSIDGERHRGTVALAPIAAEQAHTVFFGDGSFSFREKVFTPDRRGAAAGDATFAAPMHGSIVALLVEPGSDVEAGDPVLVLEAMKMEQTLRAPAAGRVEAYHCKPGDLVDRGTTLVDFTAEHRSA